MIVLSQNSVWATHTQPLPCFLQCIVGHRDRPAGHQLHRAHWGRDEFVSKSRLQDLCLRSLWCHLQAVGHPWWHVQAVLHRARVWHQCRRCEYRSDTSKKSKGCIKTIFREEYIYKSSKSSCHWCVLSSWKKMSFIGQTGLTCFLLIVVFKSVVMFFILLEKWLHVILSTCSQ